MVLYDIYNQFEIICALLMRFTFCDGQGHSVAAAVPALPINHDHRAAYTLYNVLFILLHIFLICSKFIWAAIYYYLWWLWCPSSSILMNGLWHLLWLYVVLLFTVRYKCLFLFHFLQHIHLIYVLRFTYGFPVGTAGEIRAKYHASAHNEHYVGRDSCDLIFVSI